MRAITKFAAAAAALSMSAFAGSAQAAIFLGLSIDGGGTIVAGTDFNPLADVLNGFDMFGGFQISTNADNGVAPTLLNSTTIDTKFTGSGAATLDVYVTRTGIVGPMPAFGYKSAFTNNIIPAGWTVRERTYVSAADALYTGTLLGDVTFLAPGTSTQFGLPVPGAGPYSVTTRYTISAAAGEGSALSTITLSARAVPEPGTWALMIMGFGGAGALLRSRRRAVAA